MFYGPVTYSLQLSMPGVGSGSRWPPRRGWPMLLAPHTLKSLSNVTVVCSWLHGRVSLFGPGVSLWENASITLNSCRIMQIFHTSLSHFW